VALQPVLLPFHLLLGVAIGPTWLLTAMTSHLNSAITFSAVRSPTLS